MHRTPTLSRTALVACIGLPLVLGGCLSLPSDGFPAATAQPRSVTLTMLSPGNQMPKGQDTDVDILPARLKQKFPEYDILVEKLPDEQYQSLLIARLAGGDGPDLFHVWPRRGLCGAWDLAEDGHLMDLTDLDVWNGISDENADAMTWNGRRYAVTRNVGTLGVYVNLDLFRQAGVETLPDSWPAFLETCGLLKKAGVVPLVSGDRDPVSLSYGLYQIAANVVYSADPAFDRKLSTGETALTDPNWIRSLKMLDTLYRKEYIPQGSLLMGNLQAGGEFSAGHAAMAFGGVWDFSLMTGGGEPAFEIAFMPLPANEAGTPTRLSQGASAGRAANAATRHPDEVKRIFEYLYGDEYRQTYATAPATQSTANAAASATSDPPASLRQQLYGGIAALREAGGTGPFCDQYWPAEVRSVMQERLQQMIGRQITPEEVAQAMQEALVRSLPEVAETEEERQP